MPEVINSLMDELDGIGWKYQPPQVYPDGNTVLRSGVNGKNAQYTITMVFDEKGHTVCLRVFDLIPTPDEKRFQLLELINTLNRDYRWARFFLSQDSRLQVQVDHLTDGDRCAQEIVELIMRLIRIIDDVYPRFMRIIWGGEGE